MKPFSIALVAIFFSLNAFATSPLRTLEIQETEKTIESVEDMRSFYKGAVKFFLHNNEEPASRPMEVTVVVPNGILEGGFLDLKTLSLDSYCDASIKNATASYNSRDGLTVQIPVSFYVPETGECTIKDTLNVNVKMQPNDMSSVVAWLSNG